jgi:predicted secreted hydrolase
LNYTIRNGLWLTIVVLISAVAVWWFTRPTPLPPEQGDIPLSDFLTANDADFARADQPWKFSFPADHSAHPAYRTESWYFVGHLATRQGRQFGFQLTFFRFALAPQIKASSSAWATNHVYRGHFAITDVAQERFYAFERYSRAALGLSGATLEPVRVWVENWQAKMAAGDDNGQTPSFHLHARDEEVEMDLQLQGIKPLVLPEAGDLLPTNAQNAFHFYVVPRLAAQGQIKIGSEVFQVTGGGWLDHTWGAVPVSQGQLALNRFLLQLDDGREIVALQLHRRDGSGTPITTGILINQDGSVQQLDRRAIALDALDEWRSPRDDTTYPNRWRLSLLEQDIDLTIIPFISNQEMVMAIRYWGGSVNVSGTADNRSISGYGHVELTGYADRPNR